MAISTPLAGSLEHAVVSYCTPIIHGKTRLGKEKNLFIVFQIT